MSDQEQFLDVVDRDEAEARFRSALNLQPLGVERIAIDRSLGRVLAANVLSQVDVPAFDRSNFDGYAVRAMDTYGACESKPQTVDLLPGSIDAGCEPLVTVLAGQALAIATGGMLPRGADAILMVEHAEERGGRLDIRRSLTPGFGISYAGTDIAMGETVLRQGTVLTSRETGVLAAIGQTEVEVWRRPKVMIISTGNEIVAPGTPLRPAAVYDSNSQVLSDAVREQGGIAIWGGIVGDNVDKLRTCLNHALAQSDLVVLSGGTSKGNGDLCYRVVAELTDPGIIVHGVALKPGKPICLAVTLGKPVVVLPGFPTSAIFTFHEFVAPVIRLLAGRKPSANETDLDQSVEAKMALRINSEIGRTEYLLVGIIKTDDGLAAFPMGKGSGSVTLFSRADGFVTIARHTEIVDAGATVRVRLLGRDLELADLIIIGSNCIGLDYLISKLHDRGIRTKLLCVGSSAGLLAAQRSECDVAGIHLLDPISGQYNRPYLDDSLTLIDGYRRAQGIVFRPDDVRFLNRSPREIVTYTVNDPEVILVSRNQGSGTRVIIDRLLEDCSTGDKRLASSPLQPSNHSAVAAAILQHRADWGVAIEATARAAKLAFVPLQDEQFDFAIPKSRIHRPAVQTFIGLLCDSKIQRELAGMGFLVQGQS